VLVDSCPIHGTWFDAGEVHRIANASTMNADKRSAPEPSSELLRSRETSSTTWTAESVIDGLSSVFDEIDRYR
jgi:hypothetical protein